MSVRAIAQVNFVFCGLDRDCISFDVLIAFQPFEFKEFFW